MKKQWLYGALLVIGVVAFSTKQYANIKRYTMTEDLKESSVRLINYDINMATISLPCPSGMALVEGNYCPNLFQNCLRWTDKKIAHKEDRDPRACAEFSPSKCLSKETKYIKVCVDKFEYPNKEGTVPDVMFNFFDAQNMCAAEGKRLCSDIEWTKACEGPDNLPYPYGYSRDDSACNIDRPWIEPNFEKLGNKDWAEVIRLDQRVPSGSMPRCVSQYGVFDMTGNVDEQVINTRGKPYKVEERGGHWAKWIRNRCRAETVAHNEWFEFYTIGFRCCSNIKNDM